MLAVGVAVLGSAVPAAAEPTAPATAQDTPGDTPKDAPAETLGSHDAELLAKAEGKGARNVTLIIATDTGEAADVAGRGQEARRHGHPPLRQGRLRAGLGADRQGASRRPSSPGVSAVDLDETIQLPDPAAGPRRQGRRQAGRHAARPGREHAGRQPVHADAARSARSTFKRKHPTWDGRGVTIGIMDSGVDLDHPALQTTSTGERKIVDWVTATDPVLEGDGTWRAMLTEVAGPSFTSAAHLDGAGRHVRFNRFTEAITAASDPGGDVNRDGDTTDVFGILYDPASHDIRVDVNQNRDFTDDAVMRPYKEKFDVGHFGTDNPATAIVEQHAVRRRVPRGRRPRPRPGCRASSPTSSTSASRSDRTARTSPASPPPTTCSATRTSTARRPAPRSSPPGPAPGAVAAPRPR